MRLAARPSTRPLASTTFGRGPAGAGAFFSHLRGAGALFFSAGLASTFAAGFFSAGLAAGLAVPFDAGVVAGAGFAGAGVEVDVGGEAGV